MSSCSAGVGVGHSGTTYCTYMRVYILEIVHGDKLLLNAQFSILYNKFYVGVKTTPLGLQNGLKNNNWNTFD
jgi:hypothetical protein